MDLLIAMKGVWEWAVARLLVAAREQAVVRAEIPVEVFPDKAHAFPAGDPVPVEEKGAGDTLSGVFPQSQYKHIRRPPFKKAAGPKRRCLICRDLTEQDPWAPVP
jgi:hypothetical protein